MASECLVRSTEHYKQVYSAKGTVIVTQNVLRCLFYLTREPVEVKQSCFNTRMYLNSTNH